jgi:serine protease AprX
MSSSVRSVTWRVASITLVVLGLLTAAIVPARSASSHAADEDASSITLSGLDGDSAVSLSGLDDVELTRWRDRGFDSTPAGPHQPVTATQVRHEVLGPMENLTGAGVDVALIDSGVSLVPGLDGPGQVVFGPDLSVEGMDPAKANVDSFGHGTHMAGIIAGDDGQGFLGLAPDARLVSVKVAGADGGVAVEQVVAGIDWVVEHRTDNGLDIRVLNLSLGADGVDSYQGDILSAAVERAWHSGIVVVVSGGNRGSGRPHLDSPAVDPYVIAVGGTESFSTESDTDDKVAPWSSRATGWRTRSVDLVAPATSIVSLLAPGSAASANTDSVVDGRFIRGSGSSQGAAVVSGTVAALLQRYPDLTPDAVKVLLAMSGANLEWGRNADGFGRVTANRVESDATLAWVLGAVQTWPRAVDSMPADFAAWTGGTWSGATWSGGTWSGATWSGATWSGATWSGATWSGATWSGATWSGGTWSGATWS